VPASESHERRLEGNRVAVAGVFSKAFPSSKTKRLLISGFTEKILSIIF
jgi:hypothetical protein